MSNPSSWDEECRFFARSRSQTLEAKKLAFKTVSSVPNAGDSPCTSPNVGNLDVLLR